MGLDIRLPIGMMFTVIGTLLSGYGLIAALDLVEVMEYAWHDCYDEITPPDQVIEDLLVCAQGSVETLIRAVHLGITDWRDLRMWADGVRQESGGS